MSKSFRAQSEHLLSSPSVVAPIKTQGLSLQAKTMIVAVALCTLPVLVLGTAASTFGRHLLKEQQVQIEQAHPSTRDEIRHLGLLLQRQLHLTMLATGVTSALAAAIALLWARRSVRPTLAAASTVAATANQLLQFTRDPVAPQREQAPQDELQALSSNLDLVVKQSQALAQNQQTEEQQFQLLIQIADRLRQSMTPGALLKTAVTEVRQMMEVDRVVFFRLESNGDGTVVAESLDDKFPPILGSTIIDPCFKEKHFGEYQQGRVRAINNIHRLCCINIFGSSPVLNTASMAGALVI